MIAWTLQEAEFAPDLSQTSDIREPRVDIVLEKRLMLRQMKKLEGLFFFFKSPCMFLTAPSSCVTFFSYLPSIKGFLMTRVNPEHEECRGVQCGSEDQKARLYLNLLTLAFVVGRTFQQISGADQRRSRRSFTVLCAQCQHHGMVKVRERNLHTQYSLKIQIYMIFCLKKNHKYTLLSL